MATWEQFRADAPRVAAFAGRLWPGITVLQGDGQLSEVSAGFAIAYLATARRDGSPRLHPVCPILAGGRLFVAIPRSSPKGWDLRRDSRCVVHALPGPDDDELCIRANAIEVTEDASKRKAVLDVVTRGGVGGMIETVSHDALFELDLEQVDVARWLDIGQPGTRAVRQRWRAAESP